MQLIKVVHNVSELRLGSLGVLASVFFMRRPQKAGEHACGKTFEDEKLEAEPAVDMLFKLVVNLDGRLDDVLMLEDLLY